MQVEPISLIVSLESQSESLSYGLQIGFSVSRHENDIILTLQANQSSWTPGTVWTNSLIFYSFCVLF